MDGGRTEVAWFIELFHDDTEPKKRPPDTKHHDRPARVQIAILKEV